MLDQESTTTYIILNGNSDTTVDENIRNMDAIYQYIGDSGLSQLVGSFSQMDANRETAKIKRETPLRPGPHPHRSARASLDPHSSFMY